MFSLCMAALFSTTHFHDLNVAEKQCENIVWESSAEPFDELILSWEAERPTESSLVFYVSLHQEEWSPWLKYAEWGPSFQKTFRSISEVAETFQDAAYPKSGSCDRFRIKAEGPLNQLGSMTACTALLSSYSIAPPGDLPYVFLKDFPLQSQMTLDHIRNKHLCSPTSTANAINYLLGEKIVDPTDFAAKIHDDEFDIYGNWILNTAEATRLLAGRYRCHAERMKGFASLHERLMQGLPVVVSVKGNLPGAPQPYNSGHLICVVGYDPREEAVYCVDPAYPTNESTLCAYPLKDFLAAWGTRYNLAYLFN
ncbi:MAG: C39 family peptidase [Verrucomicrobia bacterium]|nr:C39 family peptidase [Verrucomicrobiota bacterium]